jgi:hypothetical protein
MSKKLPCSVAIEYTVPYKNREYYNSLSYRHKKGTKRTFDFESVPRNCEFDIIAEFVIRPNPPRKRHENHG